MSKPCPFCGGCAKETTGQDGSGAYNFYIMCKKCKMVMKSKQRDELIANWNRRCGE